MWLLLGTQIILTCLSLPLPGSEEANVPKRVGEVVEVGRYYQLIHNAGLVGSIVNSKDTALQLTLLTHDV